VTKFFRQVDIDSTAVNGVEMLRWNVDGLINEFNVRVRPLLHAHQTKAASMVSRNGVEGEGPSIYISDPEGNRLELKELPKRF
jgi:hypothetical protein